MYVLCKNERGSTAQCLLPPLEISVKPCERSIIMFLIATIFVTDRYRDLMYDVLSA